MQMLCSELRLPTHIALENFRDTNTAIRTLVVFHNSDQRPTYSQARAIQGMQKFRLAGIGVTPPRLHAPRLVIPEAGTGGNFPVGRLARQPDFQIVSAPR